MTATTIKFIFLATFWRHVKTFFEEIKFEHSVFALPFAVLSAFMAFGGLPNGIVFTWIIMAMVSARTFGMTSNRLVDAHIDARNPRTAGRALPSGRLSRINLWSWVIVAGVLFGLSVSRLDPLAWKLAPIAAAILWLYPYAKRVTWLSHFALGGVYLIVPPATWIALGSGIPAGSIMLGFAGMFWVAGFDIIYATADVEIDKTQGLYSIPARFGVARALVISRFSHVAAVVFLVVAGILLNTGILYFVGTAAVVVLLAYEQSLVSARDLSRLNAAFFTMNGVIAVVFGIFVSAGSMLE